MSGVVKALTHPVRTIKKGVDASLHPVRTVKGVLGLNMPDLPEIPGVPTIDQAAQNQQYSDRILRRRGILATIFGGSSSSQPNVGRSTLGGS